MIKSADILAEIAALKAGPFTVGFAAETEKLEEHARAKFERKNLVMIVGNLVCSNLCFDRDDNSVLVLWSDGRKEFEEYWRNIFDKTAAGEIDTWDYQWTFSCWANDGLTCLPEKNLVCNLGFGRKAKHPTDTNSWQANLPM